jgi:mRNA interferase HicA
VKRRDIIKALERNGFIFKRHGGKHDIYWNSSTQKTVPVERHKDIDDDTAKEIFKEAGL